jgi:NAD(P)H dehydrogenase (quinone)
MPRTCLLVTCHPDPSSLCGSLAATVRDTLRDSGAEVLHHDLCTLGFDPVVQQSEFASYASGTLPADVAPLAAHLKAADALIFIFPVWMYGVPAQLKGYFDRVWRPGVTFALTPTGVRPLLGHLTHLTVIATHGMHQAGVAESGDGSALLFAQSLPSVLPNLNHNHRFDIYDLDRPDRARIAFEIESIRQHFEVWGG